MDRFILIAKKSCGRYIQAGKAYEHVIVRGGSRTVDTPWVFADHRMTLCDDGRWREWPVEFFDN